MKTLGSRFVVGYTLLLVGGACARPEGPPAVPAASAPSPSRAADSPSAPVTAAPAAPEPALAAAPAALPGPDVPAAALAAFGALPEHFFPPDTPPRRIELLQLGRELYFDKRLSRRHDVACASCHDLARSGADGQATSAGHPQQRGTRNTPSVLNAAGQLAQGWDGRAADVEAQIRAHLLAPLELGMKDEASVVAVLASIPGYVEAFGRAFPESGDPVTFEHAAVALGAFGRSFSTPGRWDRFVRGDRTALSDEEKVGFNVFVQANCVKCHTGPLVGGTKFAALGVARPWPDARDAGRFEVTKVEADRGTFKVPSLRNVARTAPYFHDGSVATLDEAVRRMGAHQLGADLSDAQVGAIVTFLGALTGEVPEALTRAPELPPSGPKTPAPEPN